MKAKLSKLQERLAEIQKLLIDSETIKDMDNYTLLNKEFADLKPIVDKFDEYNSVLAAINDANEILESGDEDLKSLAEEELKESLDKPDKLEQELKLMLLPKDSADDGSAFLEIRAGAGGDEAGIFAGDLFRMYSRLAEREGWNVDVIDIKQAERYEDEDVLEFLRKLMEEIDENDWSKNVLITLISDAGTRTFAVEAGGSQESLRAFAEEFSG